MHVLRYFILMSMLLCFLGMNAQNNCGYIAGFSCSTAPVICDVNCLNGFQGQLFPASNTNVKFYEKFQPGVACSTGGKLQNPSWFAFVAGSTSMQLSITPSNCLLDDGIQVGIFADCNFSDDTLLGKIPIESEFIACFDPTGNKPETINLNPTDLIIGQTYYFFVDGYNGDQCKYTVNVITASQADTIPNLLKFDQGSSIDTVIVCKNTEVELTKKSYLLTSGYFWQVLPKSPLNPLSEFSQLDVKGKKFKFTEAGTFTVRMYADNGCDATDTIEKVIKVVDPKDELFDEVTLCANQFPYAGPQLQDPNGDGTQGWQGPKILAPGNTNFTVLLAPGCKYTQSVKVNGFPTSATKKITLADCGPIKYYNLDITDNLINFDYTLPVTNQYGCDSIVNIDAYILSVKGQLQQSGCNNGTTTITFIEESLSAGPSYTIRYIWYDENNTIITDNNSNPKDIDVNNAKSVSLKIEIDVNGKMCSFDLGQLIIDPATQLPKTPIVDVWPSSFCHSMQNINLSVVGQGNSTSYAWTINGGSILSNDKLDNINISVDPNPGLAKVCVEAINGCGNSPKLCRDIAYEAPSASSVADKLQICSDSVLIVQSSNLGYSYTWTLNQATVLSGNLNSKGPIRLKYTVPSITTIPIVLTETKNGCSTTHTSSVTVIPSMMSPVISTTSFANKIEASWQGVPCANGYLITIDNVEKGIVSTTNFVIDNLKIGQKINLSVTAISGDPNCACGRTTTLISASTLDCNNVVLDASVTKNIFCEESVEEVDLDMKIAGNTLQNKWIWSGQGVKSNETFSTKDLGVGQYKIFADYEELGCKYKDSITLNIVSKPKFGLEPTDPMCKDDIFGALQILPEDETNIIKTLVDDKIKESFNLNDITIGTHKVELIDINQCKQVKSFSISSPSYPKVGLVLPDQQLFDNTGFQVALIDSTAELKLIDSIVWYINGEIFCSGKACSKATFPPIEAGIYEHQIIIFYKDCFLREQFDINVNAVPEIYASNIFKIDNTGINNAMIIKSNYPDLVIDKMTIYNRWGSIVYQTKNLKLKDENQIWDGKVNGVYVIPDVYLVTLEYIDHVNQKVMKTFDVTVIR